MFFKKVSGAPIRNHDYEKLIEKLDEEVLSLKTKLALIEATKDMEIEKHRAKFEHDCSHWMHTVSEKRIDQIEEILKIAIEAFKHSGTNCCCENKP